MAYHKNEITRQILLKYLVEGICKLTFIKRDGTTRHALSTLNYDLIPAKFEEALGKIFLPDANQEILPFWDVAQGAWKSCYINSIQNFITANELNKNIPDNDQKHSEINSENMDADDIQDIDDNENTKSKSSQKITNRKIDKTSNEKTVDPVNRQNVKKHGHRINTKSSITEEYEKKKRNLETARHIINKLRSQGKK